MNGYLSIVLHAHLPFVRHPEYEEFLEERWFFEALTETYVPILKMLHSLRQDRVGYALTMNISPTLCSMLSDELLMDRYAKYLDKMIELASKEIDRTRWAEDFNKLAHMYYHRFSLSKDLVFNKWGRDLLGQFKSFQDEGNLEIITCGATHGYLPLIGINERASIAQIRVGVESYRKYFHRDPRGIWLPECGYYVGVDKYLKSEGIKFFITETHGVLFSRPRPKYGVYAPYYTPEKVAVFGRDTESSKSVWSAEEGYPGDYNYREYYRDLGFDLDYDYIAPYISPDGARIFTGMKYYRITGTTKHKEVYDYKAALSKAADHAGNFMFNRQHQLNHLASRLDRKPLILSPYDAELFGHWWFEGVDFLNFLIRKIHFDQNDISLITPSQYLGVYPKNQVLNPAASSWGYKGYSEVWLCGANDWVYPHLHKACDVMVGVASSVNGVSHLKKRILNQMTRELLLAQSSDWAFIMKTGTFTEYAKKRTIEHLRNFYTLLDQYKKDNPREDVLRNLESKNNLFSEINYSVFSKS